MTTFQFPNGKTAFLEKKLGPLGADKWSLTFSFKIEGKSHFEWTCPGPQLTAQSGSIFFFHTLQSLIKVDTTKELAWSITFPKNFVTGIKLQPPGTLVELTDLDARIHEHQLIPVDDRKYKPGIPSLN